MCGIAGIVQGEGEESSLRAPLLAMSQALRHRGPDDSGLFVGRQPPPASPAALCGLAHTRLSILDLSPAGHQPMSSPDGRYLITFNGEIYNFRELRKDLEREGEVFRTGTDTEVILRLYAREGERCVERLRGMFAFGIWDTQTGTCFLARDPLGIKPLYYSLNGGRLVFASELRALIQAGLVPRRIHPGALYGYFLLGSVPEPLTLLDGVECLPAGHCLTWHQGRANRRAYWKIDFNGKAPAPADPAAHTRAALLESLERHFVSDVPVGIFLSGGIDSTALLALATRVLGRRASTFCISFDQASLNEGGLAARTAAHFGSDHHDWRLGAPEARQLLPEYMTVADQPSIDGFNTFSIARHARNQGMKVVLSGQGGDELFSGYPSFVRVPKLLQWGRAASVLGPATRLAGSLLERQAPQPRWRRVGHFLQNPTSLGSAYLSVRGIFTPQEAATLARSCLAHPAAADTLPQAGEFLRIDTQPTLADEIGLLELSRYMRNQLLRDSDVMSMASSLELRVPFVDHTFVDALAAIPSAHRLRPGKRLLLEAVPEIPEWVSNRPKQGFVFPFQQWLMDEWHDWFATVDARAPVPLFNWYRRWSLLALENFVKTYQVQGTTLPG